MRYWAHRTRESLRDAERCAREDNYGLAEDLAVQASGEAGEAGEFAIAMRDLALAQGV